MRLLLQALICGLQQNLSFEDRWAPRFGEAQVDGLETISRLRVEYHLKTTHVNNPRCCERAAPAPVASCKSTPKLIR